VAERLRKLPNNSAGFGVDFLGEQPTSFANAAARSNTTRARSGWSERAIACRARTCKGGTCPLRLRDHRATGSGRRPSLVCKPLLGRVDRRKDAESSAEGSDECHHQIRRVEIVGARRLSKRLGGVAPARSSRSCGGPRRAPAPTRRHDRARQPIGERDCPLERDPAHELRVHEVAPVRPAPPNPLVALVPAFAQRCRPVRRRTSSSAERGR